MKSAQANILKFLQQNKGQSFASGELQRMTFKNKNGTLATPRSLVRRLEELAEAGEIKVSYDTHNHAHYSADESKIPTRKEFAGYVERDGHRYATFKEVVVV